MAASLTFKMTVRGSLSVRICPDCGEGHRLDEWPDNHRKPGEVLAAPNVVRADMPAIQGQHDGKMYDSKRAIRASYLPSGNAEGKYYVEVGNDEARLRPHKKPKPKGIKDAIAKAAADLNSGRVTEATRQKLLSRPGPVLSAKYERKTKGQVSP